MMMVPETFFARFLWAFVIVGLVTQLWNIHVMRSAHGLRKICGELPLGMDGAGGYALLRQPIIEESSERIVQQQGPPPPTLPLPRKTAKDLVVMVLSRRTAPNIRQAIRDTWGRGHDNVYFVIGQACAIPKEFRGVDHGGNLNCEVAPKPLTANYFQKSLDHVAYIGEENRALLREQEDHGDLLLMDAPDIYSALPKKLKYMYTFVDRHLPAANWILKVDDDFFVKIDKFEKYVNQEYGQMSDDFLMIGAINWISTAHMEGKWKEVPQFPFGGQYPPFPLGSFGHVVSRPVAHHIATYQDALFDYQGEDTSIGIWLDHPEAPRTKFEKSSVMANDGNCLDELNLVIGHDIIPPKMKHCYDATLSYWSNFKARPTGRFQRH